MPFTGDMAGIALLRAALRELAKVPSRLAAPVAARLTKRLRAQFAAATDPYGKPHARNAPRTIAKKGFDHPMTETGNSAAETRAVPMGSAGISVQTTEEVWWNMTPGTNRPARPMLPIYGLPATWRADIKTEADAAMARIKRPK